MVNISESAIEELCLRLQIDSEFFVQCLQESVVEIQKIDGHWVLSNGTVLRLRQLERICDALNVDLSVALLLSELTTQVADLEEKVRLLRSSE